MTNVLSYTTLNPFPCKESLHKTPGSSCFTKKTLHKLNKLEKELNTDKKDYDPVVIDEELLPNDGSVASNMIRRLAAILDCSSEYCLLSNKEVKTVLNDSEIEKEKQQFKIKGPRLRNVGTDGEKHAYRVLLQWSEVFDFFYPFPHVILSETELSKQKFNVNEFMKIIRDQYPAVRVIAADMSIEIKSEETCGWHAVVILIDMRGSSDSEWTIEYFDSAGFPPTIEVSHMMEGLADSLQKFRRKVRQTGEVKTVIVTGRLKHQLTSSECGMHALIYIRRRLEGISYKMFSKYKIPDNFAKEFRRDIFVI